MWELKTSPPKCVPLLVDLTSNNPSSMDGMETSKVPPPKSNTRTLRCESDLLSEPYAMVAAVGTLAIRNTFKPAALPASIVARHWLSLKYATPWLRRLSPACLGTNLLPTSSSAALGSRPRLRKWSVHYEALPRLSTCLADSWHRLINAPCHLAASVFKIARDQIL